ncbi:MAG TPA: A/G-specific adenine glycosylase [Chloroflexaceae bacterium]|nr:A/G-specific adenine glycosylase [Chloroflexaceae bacterium]
MSSHDLSPLQGRLLVWFAERGRDLPWRRTRDPYRILVSEIMLQQTQVDRVIPKYLAFLEAFPTLEALAAAPTAEVIRLWQGLGYNRRAVNLQRAARAVRDEHSGAFPREVEALRRLPGVGPYTAGAVACFAFEQDVAFVDTNIRRVLRRSLVGPDGASPEPTDRELLALGQALVPAGRGWAWNQAIMELGALVCTAAAPACRQCPLRADCRAHAAWVAADEAAVLAMGAPAAAPPARARRVAERREAPYEGSRRWFRGRLVDALRALPHGAALPLAELGPLVKPGFAPDELPWLRELAAGLARDGLVALEGDAARLP